MSKPVKALIWIVAILVGLTLAAVIVVKVVFTKERILAMVTPRLEEAINRPVSIGDAGISLWGGIGVWLGDVAIDNREGFSDEPFLTIHRLELKARFWPLLTGHVELDRVLLEAPSLLLEYDAEGGSNLEGLAQVPADTTMSADTTQAAKPKPVSDEAALAAPITVDHFVLTGGELMIRHAEPEREIKVSGLDLDLQTHKRINDGMLAFNADMALDSVSVTGVERSFTFREGHPEAYLAGFLNQQDKAVQFDTIGLNWMGALIALQGRVQSYESITDIQVNAQITPTQVRAIVDQAYGIGLLDEPLDLDGELRGDMQASLVWPLAAGTVPDWSARLYLSNLKYIEPDTKAEVTVPRLEINGEGRVVSWNLAGGKLPGGTFSSSGSIDRVFAENREASARITFDVDLAQASPLFATPAMPTMTGRINADLNAFGPIANWKSTSITGPLKSSNLVLIDPAWSVDTVSLDLDWKFTGNDLTIRSTSFRARHSSATITGSVADLVPSVLASFEPPHVPRAELTLNSPYLNLDELMAEEETPPAKPAKGEETVAATDTSAFVFPTMAATGTLTCDTVIFNEMTITKATAPFTFQDNILTFDPVNARVYGGTARGAARWDLNDWESPTFAARVEADSVQTNDFLSRYLGWAGGVFGRVKFTGEFAGKGRESAEILPNLTASGRVSMADGQLQAAPLLATIGTKLGMKDLDQPRKIREYFTRYRIENGRIYSDTMVMATDQANWAAAGSYGFDQSLNYAINLKLTDAGKSKYADLLKATNFKIDLKGKLTSPIVNIDVAETGQSVLKNAIQEQLKDSTGVGQKARDLLQGLFKKKP